MSALMSISATHKLQRLMGRSVRLETGDPSLNLDGSFAAQDGVDQTVELGGELGVGERVLSVAGGMRQLANKHGAVDKGHGNAVGYGRGVAVRERGIFDDPGAADEVVEKRVIQAFGSELGGRNLAVHEGDRRAVGKTVVGGLAGSGTPLFGVLGDDFEGRAESGDLDGPDPPGVADLGTKLEGRGDRRLA